MNNLINKTINGNKIEIQKIENGHYVFDGFHIKKIRTYNSYRHGLTGRLVGSFSTKSNYSKNESRIDADKASISDSLKEALADIIDFKLN
jgi:hypothetical protein